MEKYIKLVNLHWQLKIECCFKNKNKVYPSLIAWLHSGEADKIFTGDEKIKLTKINNLRNLIMHGHFCEEVEQSDIDFMKEAILRVQNKCK